MPAPEIESESFQSVFSEQIIPFNEKGIHPEEKFVEYRFFAGKNVRLRPYFRAEGSRPGHSEHGEIPAARRVILLETAPVHPSCSAK